MPVYMPVGELYVLFHFQMWNIISSTDKYIQSYTCFIGFQKQFDWIEKSITEIL